MLFSGISSRWLDQVTEGTSTTSPSGTDSLACTTPMWPLVSKAVREHEARQRRDARLEDRVVLMYW